MVTRRDYTAEAVEAAKSVLIELTHLLGEYRDNIYYCLLAYPEGIDALVEEFRPHLSHGLVREGLTKIAKHYFSLKALGPKFVADFEEADDPEERARIMRDAFERANAFLNRLGFA